VCAEPTSPRSSAARPLEAGLWRREPGRDYTLHRHLEEAAVYVPLKGAGRYGRPLATRGPHQLGLVAGALERQSYRLEMSDDRLAALYLNGPRALPAELGGGASPPD
jgi:hypothetical protein